MKMKSLPLMALLCTGVITACEEQDLSSLLDSSNSDLAVAYVGAESDFLDIYQRVELAMRDSTLLATGSTTMDGAAVSLNPVSGTLSINFGNTNVLTSDGKARRGSINISNLTPTFLTVPNSSMQVSTNEFYVDDDKTELFFQTINRGLSGTAQHFEVDTFALDVENGNYQLRGHKNFYWLQGFTTINQGNDDIYRMEGFSRAVGQSNGAEINATFSVASPFTVDRSCDYTVTQGIIDLVVVKSEGNQTGSVDFIPEDGCNNLMRVSLNGLSTTVPMPDF